MYYFLSRKTASLLLILLALLVQPVVPFSSDESLRELVDFLSGIPTSQGAMLERNDLPPRRGAAAAITAALQKDQAATVIATALKKDEVSQWGFVIFRCTYSSQEKWDRLLALVKQRTREHFEKNDMMDVYEKNLWTVIEDPAGLDGADLRETSRRFAEWFYGTHGDGGREMKQDGCGLPVDRSKPYKEPHPRYFFYLHVDEEDLESVVDEERAGTWQGNCLKVVHSGTVISGDQERQWRREERHWLASMGGDPYVEESDEEWMLELRKKVKIDDIVDLYAHLLERGNGNKWSKIVTEDGVCKF